MEPNTPIVSAPVEPTPAAPVTPVAPVAPKKSSNVVLIIILAVLALAGIGFGVYEFLQNQNQNQSQSQTPTEEPETSKFEITNEEAEKTIAKYLSLNEIAHYVDVTYDKTPFGENGYNDKNFHAQVAFENISPELISTTSCPETPIADDCKTVSYEDMNAKYKELFGGEKNLEKTEYSFACSILAYDSTKNTFIQEIGGCGGTFQPFGYYKLKDTEALSDGYNINVYFTEAKYDLQEKEDKVEVMIQISLSNGTTKILSTGNDGLSWPPEIELVDKYADQLPVYQFQFKQDAGNFVLTDVVKL